jgi:hypothetical protein
MNGFKLVLCGVIALALFPGISVAGVGPELNDMGSFGFSLGAMRWFADSDAREYTAPEIHDTDGGGTAQIRPMLKANFRYRRNENWLLAVEVGFGWNSYPDTEDLTLRVTPFTVGLEKKMTEIYGTTAYWAFGAGLYHWTLRRGRDVMVDPVTFKDLTATDPGVYTGLTNEWHLTSSVTLMTQATFHFMLSTHGDDFKGMLGDSDMFADVKMGLNCYFSPHTGFGKGDEEGE